jgi:Flp pilus assembly protein TadD
LGKIEEAEAALMKTIELKPDDFYAMNNLAVLFIRTQRLPQAVEIGRRAVSVEPGYVNGYVTLGSALAMTGDIDSAESAFREALRLEPGNESASSNLQKLNQQRGQR